MLRRELFIKTLFLCLRRGNAYDLQQTSVERRVLNGNARTRLFFFKLPLRTSEFLGLFNSSVTNRV